MNNVRFKLVHSFCCFMKNAVACHQALGVCSHSDRSVLKKKLKEIKKMEEKRLKQEKEVKIVVLEGEDKNKAKTMLEGKCVSEARRSGKTVRTESIL